MKFYYPFGAYTTLQIFDNFIYHHDGESDMVLECEIKIMDVMIEPKNPIEK